IGDVVIGARVNKKIVIEGRCKTGHYGVGGKVTEAYRHGMILIAVLGGDESKKLVWDERSSHRAAELLAGEGRFCAQQRRLRLQYFAAQVAEAVAVPGVGAGLGDDVDDAGGRAPDLGSVAVGGDLKFLNAVLGKVGQGAADHFIVVIGAIYTDIAAAAKSACGGDFQGVGLGGIVIRSRA